MMQMNLNLLQLSIDVDNLKREIVFLKKEVDNLRAGVPVVAIDDEAIWKAEYNAKFEDLDVIEMTDEHYHAGCDC